MGSQDDILVDIPDEDVPELMKIYKDHEDSMPDAVGALHYYMKWKRRSPNDKTILLMSPNVSWRLDGTFLMFCDFGNYDLYAATLDDKGEILYKAILRTNRIDFDKHPRGFMFYNLQWRHREIVMQAMKERGIELNFEVLTDHFTLPFERAINFSYKIPEEVYVDTLKPEDAENINSLWPHRYENSQYFIKELCSREVGYGLHLKTNNELVAWVVLGVLNQPTMLEVKPEHKRKGYGSFLVKFICKKIAAEGISPTATVVVTNEASRTLFNKLGFYRQGLTTFITYKSARH